MQDCLLSTAYLPPVQYITKFLVFKTVYIEYHENFQKQSYRNRCVIYGANGPLTLSIPLIKNSGQKTKIHNVEIDYNTDNWQKLHLKSIESAYRHSAFFEYYFDPVEKHIMYGYKYLYELNFNLLQFVLDSINIKNTPVYTEKYKKFHNNDFRNSIHPKTRCQKPDKTFRPVEYFQVFKEKHGFIPNLSIIDLLFNCGPESILILKQSTLSGN